MDWTKALEYVGPLAGAVIVIVLLYGRYRASDQEFLMEQRRGWQDFVREQREADHEFTGNHMSHVTTGMYSVSEALAKLSAKIEGCPVRGSGKSEE